MIAIGIDIGLTGAVAFDDGQSSAVEDMPVHVDPSGDRCIDAWGLHELLRKCQRPGLAAIVMLEDIRVRNMSRGGPMSHMAEGSLMRSRGIVEGVLGSLRLRYEVVQPQTWKRWYGLIGEGKDASIACARRLHPSLEHRLARKKDDGRAESLLIASYCRKQHV